MAKLTIPTPNNCIECELLKEWHGTIRNTTFVRCHAGECEMPDFPGNYSRTKNRPDYCPLIDEDAEERKPFVFAPR